MRQQSAPTADLEQALMAAYEQNALSGNFVLKLEYETAISGVTIVCKSMAGTVTINECDASGKIVGQTRADTLEGNTVYPMTTTNTKYVAVNFSAGCQVTKFSINGAPLNKGVTPVVSVKFRTNPHVTHSSYKQCFVLYENVDHAKSAIKNLDQSTP